MGDTAEDYVIRKVRRNIKPLIRKAQNIAAAHCLSLTVENGSVVPVKSYTSYQAVAIRSGARRDIQRVTAAQEAQNQGDAPAGATVTATTIANEAPNAAPTMAASWTPNQTADTATYADVEDEQTAAAATSSAGFQLDQLTRLAEEIQRELLSGKEEEKKIEAKRRRLANALGLSLRSELLDMAVAVERLVEEREGREEAEKQDGGRRAKSKLKEGEGTDKGRANEHSVTCGKVPPRVHRDAVAVVGAQGEGRGCVQGAGGVGDRELGNILGQQDERESGDVIEEKEGGEGEGEKEEEEEEEEGKKGASDVRQMQGEADACTAQLFEDVRAVIKLMVAVTPAFTRDVQREIMVECQRCCDAIGWDDADLELLPRALPYNPPEVMALMKTGAGIAQLVSARIVLSRTGMAFSRMEMVRSCAGVVSRTGNMPLGYRAGCWWHCEHVVHAMYCSQ